MRKFFVFIITLIFFGFFADASAADRGTEDEALALVQKVINDMRKNGKDQVISEINTLSNRYRVKDLYIAVLDLQGKELAHGENKRLQGMNLIDLKDVDGKYFIKERLEMLKTKNTAWQDYRFVDPITKGIALKRSYLEKFEDVIVSCGVYKLP